MQGSEAARNELFSSNEHYDITRQSDNKYQLLSTESRSCYGWKQLELYSGFSCWLTNYTESRSSSYLLFIFSQEASSEGSQGFSVSYYSVETSCETIWRTAYRLYPVCIG
jgi:hypothetical protein